MPQLGIRVRGQPSLEALNTFRDIPQTRHVLGGVPAAGFIRDNLETLAQSGGQFGKYFFHRENLKRAAGWRKRPFVTSDPVKRILIVDDDVALMRVMREALTSFLRCDVDTSPKPEYGFELALKKSYDLLIFDFSMPMIDGAMLFFLIGKVYENAQTPRVIPPLLLISGRGDEKRAQELLREAGVRGFIPKPFAINRLLESVKECVPGIEPFES